MGTRKFKVLGSGLIVLLLVSVASASTVPIGPVHLPPPSAMAAVPIGPVHLPPPMVA